MLPAPFAIEWLDKIVLHGLWLVTLALHPQLFVPFCPNPNTLTTGKSDLVMIYIPYKNLNEDSSTLILKLGVHHHGNHLHCNQITFPRWFLYSQLHHPSQRPIQLGLATLSLSWCSIFRSLPLNKLVWLNPSKIGTRSFWLGSVCLFVVTLLVQMKGYGFISKCSIVTFLSLCCYPITSFFLAFTIFQKFFSRISNPEAFKLCYKWPF